MHARHPTLARTAGLLAFSLLAASAASRARADEGSPPRLLGALSTGAGLRLARNVDYGQTALSPAYVDALAGYELAGGALRHGFGLGASFAYTDDGGYTQPVIALEQLMLMPAYLLDYELSFDFVLLAHAGVPLVVAGGPNVGMELAGALGYRFLAGFGAFAELGLDAFIGSSTSVHPILTLELGLFLAYEVLP